MAPVAPPHATDREPRSRGHVLFVITEDWFFASHFLRLAEAVRAQGYAVSVHLRINDPALHRKIAEAGLRVLPSGYDRGASGRLGDLVQIARFYRLLHAERPDVVHIISFRVVMLAGIAARLAGIRVRVHGLTGTGLLGAEGSRKVSLALDVLGAVLRHGLGGAGAGFLFENVDDPRRLGFGPGRPDVLIVGGAGVDPEVESAMPFPQGATLRIAIVARMIHSKGIAVAVEALARAREAGADVELSLVGGIDPGNPRSFTEADLGAFARVPGITWLGHTTDVRGIWRDHHVACVPSLGGEGLPRSLLEAAAAGRPVVTTDTPGCATFVRPMQEGLLVAPNDADALARAFIMLARDPALVRRLGAGARRRVRDGFTLDAVSEAVLAFYDRLAADRGGNGSLAVRPDGTGSSRRR